MWALELAGQTMAGFFSSRLPQLGAIYAHLMCVLVPGLNSGRLAVYSCDHAHRNLHLSCRVATIKLYKSIS